jgi:hypothetical protein
VGEQTRNLLRFENQRAVDQSLDLVVDKLLFLGLWAFLSCMCLIALTDGFVIDEHVSMWKGAAGDYIRMLSGVLRCLFLNFPAGTEKIHCFR